MDTATETVSAKHSTMVRTIALVMEHPWRCAPAA
jgi:hypothetical protein